MPMQALSFERTGELAALHLTRLPEPELESGGVVVRVVAAGLNPSDVRNVEGAFPYTTLPRVPGRDFAGVVTQGPPELVGTEVWGTGKELGFVRNGSHAEYVALAAKGVSPKPAALTFAQAASSGVPYTTAWEALERAGATAGTRVLVIGAMGAVGKAALSLGSWRGARLAGAVRRPEQAAELEKNGVRALLVERADAFERAVREVYPDGAEVIFDTTGAWLSHAVHALATYGRVAVIMAPKGGNAEVPVLALYRRGGSIVGVNSLLHDSVACAEVLARLRVGFDDGRLAPPGDFTTCPFADALSAYQDVKAGGKKRVFVMEREGTTDHA